MTSRRLASYSSAVTWPASRGRASSASVSLRLVATGTGVDILDAPSAGRIVDIADERVVGECPLELSADPRLAEQIARKLAVGREAKRRPCT